MEDLWGWTPERRTPSSASERREADAGPHPDSPVALTGNDAMTLYWAARDCMIAGAYAGAAVLLRRLIVHMMKEKAREAGTRAEAERLFACAEELLGRPHEPPSERSTDVRDRPPAPANEPSS